MGLLEWYSLILGSNVFGEDKAWRAMLRPIVCNGLRPVSALAKSSLGAQYSQTPTHDWQHRKRCRLLAGKPHQFHLILSGIYPQGQPLTFEIDRHWTFNIWNRIIKVCEEVQPEAHTGTTETSDWS